MSADMRSKGAAAEGAAAEMEALEIHFLEEQPGQNGDRWVVTDAMQTNGVVQQTERVLLRPTDTGWKWVVGTNGQPSEETIPDQP
jgi:hypothetical protein